MTEGKVIFKSPPRLLLGVGFLFWGAIQEQAVAGFIAAIFFEARHWLPLRWHFGEKGFARAWQLCMLFLIVLAVFISQSEERLVDNYLLLLAWLPFVMMPLGLAQQYASDHGIPVTTFSFIARRKLAADRREGRAVRLNLFQLGYPFLLLLLICTGMGSADMQRYGIGLAIILGISVFCLRGSRQRPVAWLVAYSLSLSVAALMVMGVLAAYRYVMMNSFRPGNERELSMETRTAIGEVTKLQLSKSIDWRYHHESGKRPNRLRLAAYNVPLEKGWQAKRRARVFSEKMDPDRDAGGDFIKLVKEGEQTYFYQEEDRSRDRRGSGKLTGLVADPTIVPTAPGTRMFSGVKAVTLAVNSLGTTQIDEPDHGAAGIGISFDTEERRPDHDPSMRDFSLPSGEEEGLKKFIESLGLEVAKEVRPPRGRDRFRTELTFPAPKPRVFSREEVIDIRSRLTEVFVKDFKYTTFLRSTYGHPPVSYFLNEMKEGHCEYFASATAMVYRAIGVPSRYVVGYAVQERGDDEGEWILRGEHAHAWAQVYVGGEWVNEAEEGRPPLWRCRGGEWMEVDLTPPDWLSSAGDHGWMQGVADWFQSVRSAAILWFARPMVALITKIVLVVLAVGLVSFLIIRLIVTRGRDQKNRGGDWEQLLRKQGVLKDFEKWLARRVGLRPSSVTMGQWLREHLPANSGDFIAQYQRLVFKPGEPDEAELKDLHAGIDSLKRAMRSR